MKILIENAVLYTTVNKKRELLGILSSTSHLESITAKMENTITRLILTDTVRVKCVFTLHFYGKSFVIFSQDFAALEIVHILLCLLLGNSLLSHMALRVYKYLHFLFYEQISPSTFS